MSSFDVVGNAYRKVKSRYATIEKVHRKIKKRYAVVDGKYKFVWKDGVEAGEVVFTESTVWTVPEGVSVVDIFCVGGGGGAGGSYDYYTQSSSGYNSFTQRYGGGGGGGYTTTQKSVAVTPGSELTIAVGAGGASGVSYWYDSTMSPTYAGSTTSVTGGSDGGASSVVDANGTVLCNADGGKGGAKTPQTTYTVNSASYRRGGAGGAGGSGGAGGFFLKDTIQSSGSQRKMYSYATSAGIDGADGGTAQNVVDNEGEYSNTGASGGAGQGTTTRAFGESNGTLYSTGGGGDGTGAPLTGANTGDGGGVKTEYLYTSPYLPGGDGKSGIVIIRWAAQ